MRLIDADALIEIAYRIRLDSRERIEQMIESAPTVDAEPVRHGHWLNHWVGLHNDYLVFMCDQCKCINNGRTKYCPCCGAKMEEEDETD